MLARVQHPFLNPPFGVFQGTTERACLHPLRTSSDYRKDPCHNKTTFEFIQLQLAFVSEAKLTVAGNNQVVEQRAIQHFARPLKVFCELSVGSAGTDVTGDMVVHRDDARRTHRERF